MMNELERIFEYSGVQVRTIVRDGEPWFVAKDVCDVLELDDTRRAVERLDEDERSLIPVTDSLGRIQQGWAINEAGLYTLILGSRKPEARQFKRWVTHEVLPSIRKTGGYQIPNTMKDALRLAADLEEQREVLLLEVAQKDQIINELQPKATYYDLILQNKSLLPITVIAKDYGKSGDWMNKKLHEMNVQFKQGKVWLLYQKYAEKGYTQSRTINVDAEKSIFHTYWTQKGRIFIYELLKDQGILPLIEVEKQKEA